MVRGVGGIDDPERIGALKSLLVAGPETDFVRMEVADLPLQRLSLTSGPRTSLAPGQWASWWSSASQPASNCRNTRVLRRGDYSAAFLSEGVVSMLVSWQSFLRYWGSDGVRLGEHSRFRPVSTEG